jgi:hypothetical protein
MSEANAIVIHDIYLGPIRLSDFEKKLVATIVWVRKHYKDTIFSWVCGNIARCFLLYGVGVDSTSDCRFINTLLNNADVRVTCSSIPCGFLGRTRPGRTSRFHPEG